MEAGATEAAGKFREHMGVETFGRPGDPDAPRPCKEFLQMFQKVQVLIRKVLRSVMTSWSWGSGTASRPEIQL